MGHPIKINAEIVESRQRDFTISRSFATVLVTKDLQQFSGRLLDVMDNKNTVFPHWPNSLDCTDLNQCGVRRDAELCPLCYKHLKNKWRMKKS